VSTESREIEAHPELFAARGPDASSLAVALFSPLAARLAELNAFAGSILVEKFITRWFESWCPRQLAVVKNGPLTRYLSLRAHELAPTLPVTASSRLIAEPNSKAIVEGRALMACLR
jgi:hypothetical protein